MKKMAVLLSVLGLFFAVNFSRCEARIPIEDAALGGIVIGNHIDYVKQIYGEPKEVKREGERDNNGVPRFASYSYGPTFSVHTIDGPLVSTIVTTGNNGIKTSKGISVGMPFSSAVKVYGKPDFAQKGKSFTFHHYQTYSNTLTRLSFYVDNRTQKISRIILDIGAR